MCEVISRQLCRPVSGRSSKQQAAKGWKRSINVDNNVIQSMHSCQQAVLKRITLKCSYMNEL